MSANTREIITLQIGHYSNFVGTHWWNLQEASFVYDEKVPTEINHDVLYREGRTLQGEETYLPRLVLIDRKGSLNTLKSTGSLYNSFQEPNTEEAFTWKGNLSVHKEDPVIKNEFLEDLEKEESLVSDDNHYDEVRNSSEVSANYGIDRKKEDSFSSRSKYYNLDGSVKYWSDFLRMHIHPRSLCVIEDLIHDDSSNSFDFFGLGSHMWKNEKQVEQIEDKIRFFTEECDYLEAFHLIVDGNNGFAGLGSEISSYLEDEFSRKSVLSFPVFPPICENIKCADHCIHCLCNTAFALQRLSASTSMVLPLSLSSSFDNCISRTTREFPHLLYDASLFYHSSAVLAAGIESLTSPYRLKQNKLLLQDIINNTAVSGMKMVSSCLGLPFPLLNDNHDKQLQSMDNEAYLATSLMPGVEFPTGKVLRQTYVLRGLKNTRDHVNPSATMGNSSNQFSVIERMFSSCINRVSPCSYSTVKIIGEACHTTPPFPNIFLPHVSRDGLITNNERMQGMGVDKVSSIAGLVCDLSTGEMLQKLCSNVKRKTKFLGHSVLQSGMETEELKEMLDSLWEFSMNYELSPNTL